MKNYPECSTLKDRTIIYREINGNIAACQYNYVIQAFNFTPWELFYASWWSADFFKIAFFEKILSGIPSECQTDWTQIRPDILFGPDLGPNCLQRLSADD